MTLHPNNPLHGITLKTQVEELVAHYGWEKLGMKIRINCFTIDPNIKSSLTFLRRTPWARTKLDGLYIWTFFDYNGVRKEGM
jgi:uncharacterized protein (DUF2132 family)